MRCDALFSAALAGLLAWVVPVPANAQLDTLLRALQNAAPSTGQPPTPYHPPAGAYQPPGGQPPASYPPSGAYPAAPPVHAAQPRPMPSAVADPSRAHGPSFDCARATTPLRGRDLPRSRPFEVGPGPEQRLQRRASDRDRRRRCHGCCSAACLGATGATPVARTFHAFARP